MAYGKHRRPKDSSSTRRALAVCLGASVASPVVLATQANAAPVSAWDRIAECESNGRWNLPYGDNGKSSGGLQFQPASWGDALAKLKADGIDISGFPQGSGHQAYKATKNQQILAAEALLKLQGPGAWTCNALTGGPLNGYRGGDYAPYLDAPAPTPPAPKPAQPKPVVPKPAPQGGHDHYTVKRGDTLYGITKAHTGNAARDNWKPLYAANQHPANPDRINDPDLIFPGQTLNLPASWSGKSYKAPPAAPAAPSKPASKPPAPAPQGAYVLPVQGSVGDGLIVSGLCISRECGGHSGLDISAPQGTPVRAATAGTVVSVNSSGAAYGLHVVVKHSDGVFTLYAHLSAISVSNGQTVGAGQQVGNVGSTGASSGPHLHFEVRNHPTDFGVGVFLNPVTWLRSHGVTV